ncbi:MAG: nucleotidyltransferase family protein [Rhodospirillaceae bacterium]
MTLNSPNRALLLAGGYGTRLRPLTDTLPKCLIEVRGKPLLQHWLEKTLGSGIEKVIVNTHYLPDLVIEFCRNSPWSNRIELVHENEILGTAGTLRANAGLLRGHGTFFVAHADNLSVFDMNKFIETHNARYRECLGTIMTFQTESPRECGILALDDLGRVIEVHEKVENPPGNIANAAVFLLEEEVLDWVQDHPEASDFCRDVVPPLASRWFTFFNDEFHRDIGNPEALKRAENDPYWTIK